MDTVRQETNTQNTKKRFWTDYVPIERMTLVMTIFAVVYSAITGGLYCIAIRQLDGMKKDQRPWIRAISQIVVPKEGHTLNIPIVLVVSGKNPAKSISAKYYIEIVKNGEIPQLSSTNMVGGFTSGILFADGIPQPENQIPYDLLGSGIDDLKEGRIFIVVYGRIEYEDIFKTQHWTTFCGFASPKGGPYTAKKCSDYNDTDDN